MKKSLKTALALFATAIALNCAPALRAQVLTFNVDIDTTALSADNANAPFYLDFFMHYGNSALSSNTATLSNFVFTGGNAVGSPVITGTASGSLPGTVSLTESSAAPDSEFYQQFSAGTTDIKFTAAITEKGPAVGIPSTFTVSILDNSLGFPAQLFTTAPDTASLLTLNLSASNTLANVGAFSSVSSADGVTPLNGVNLTVIPEPATSGALFGATGLAFAVFYRRFVRARTA